MIRTKLCSNNLLLFDDDKTIQILKKIICASMRISPWDWYLFFWHEKMVKEFKGIRETSWDFFFRAFKLFLSEFALVILFLMMFRALSFRVSWVPINLLNRKELCISLEMFKTYSHNCFMDHIKVLFLPLFVIIKK